MPNSYAVTAIAISTLIVLTVLRLLFVIGATHNPQLKQRQRKKRDERSKLAIVLGSGGHTAEMLRLIQALDWQRYSSRVWIIQTTDKSSLTKAIEFESQHIHSGQFEIIKIPRARTVHQNYPTSILTTLKTFSMCVWYMTMKPILAKTKFADVVLLNGPGSCVPIAVACFLPKLFNFNSSHLIYVESLARTKRLSMTGKLIRPFVDRFFVQWKSLRDSICQTEQENEMRWRLKAPVECRGWLV
ncbi:UDP-N-acetylglucosamine transferase subunit [Microbotryomycetes sp. JL221]|nr:UDP-N-acetylglucosamine transferase subunit [Microbotryomycetes sp. JL221]